MIEREQERGMWMRWKQVWVLGVVVFLMGVGVGVGAERGEGAATASRGAGENTLASGTKKSTFEIWQGGKRVDGKEGRYVLEGKAFEIRVAGDVDDTFVVASTGPGFGKALAGVKRPMVALDGTGSAYGEGHLLVHRDAGIVEVEVPLGEIWGKEDEATKADVLAQLKKKLGDVPVLISTALQYVATYAEDGARVHSLEVKQLVMCEGGLFEDGKDVEPKDAEIGSVKEITLVVGISSEFGVEHFLQVDWRVIRLEFSAK